MKKRNQTDEDLKAEFLLLRGANKLPCGDSRPKDYQKMIADTLCLLQTGEVKVSRQSLNKYGMKTHVSSLDMPSWSEEQASKKENAVRVA